MGLIAIAANPASGRDIRRLISYATVFNNREKQNIVERVILAAAQMGEHRFCIMPDSFHFAERVIAHLVEDLRSVPEGLVYLPDLPCSDGQEDTTAFARYAEEQGADVLIVLGGDGTSRAAAKGLDRLPLIPISTGTNNVFPEVAEGTVVGMTAAALASHIIPAEDCCQRCKRIEISLNGKFQDIALIDVVFSSCLYSGSKALWNQEDMNRIVVTQCHPASIGFSALLGACTIVHPEDEWGAMAVCGGDAPNTRVALAAGVVTAAALSHVCSVPLYEPLTFQMDQSGILALDGERELRYRAGDTLTLNITRRGPRRVALASALALAQAKGFFRMGS